MRIDELTPEAIDYILSHLAEESRLTKWESGFIESVSDQWSRRRSLSEKQREHLGKIWDRM